MPVQVLQTHKGPFLAEQPASTLAGSAQTHTAQRRRFQGQIDLGGHGSQGKLPSAGSLQESLGADVVEAAPIDGLSVEMFRQEI